MAAKKTVQVEKQVRRASEKLVWSWKDHNLKRPEHQILAPYVWSPDLHPMDCDIILVKSLAEYDVKRLHHNILYAMMFGKRIVTLQYCENRGRNVESIKFAPVWHTKQFGFLCEDGFLAYKGVAGCLRLLCNRVGSKWVLLDLKAFNYWESKSDLKMKCARLLGLESFHSVIRKLSVVDKLHSDIALA